MLQQILREMHVDKEILAGLDETQKQTLFCKMREEQIRRWRIWDAEEENATHIKPIDEDKRNKKQEKRVNFLKAIDGDDWVWVMGEHPNDYSIEEILALEARLKAKKMAEIETSELRKSVQAELLLDYDTNKSDDDGSAPIIEETEIYCSVDELKDRILKSNVQPFMKPQFQLPETNTVTCFNFTNKEKNFEEMNTTKKQVSKVASKIVLWEKRLIGERTCEILLKLQKSQEKKLLEAEEAAKNQEELWKEQERKSKEAEIQRRSIARMAREEYRRSIQITGGDIKLTNNSGYNTGTPLSSLDVSVPKPPNKESVIKWYRDEEFPKGAGFDSEQTPAKWFHGLLTRNAAEDLLKTEKNGTFLVRISEKIWGYAISYKDLDRYKHYLVDASNGKYKFLGANQMSHDSLDDLIKYHSNVPITDMGKELLTDPCPCLASSDTIVNLMAPPKTEE